MVWYAEFSLRATKSCLAFIFIAGLLLLSSTPSLSLTYVTGEVGGQVWLRSNSPYRVSGETTVALGSILTIEAGVTVEFGVRAGSVKNRIYANGTIRAVGTPEGIITFTSSKETGKAQGDWDSIYFEGAGTNASLVKYCRVEFSIFGVYINNSSAMVQNSTFRSNTTSIHVYNTDSFKISDNSISSVVNGIYLHYAVGEITGNLISGCATGIYLETACYPYIFGNTIVYNTTLGIDSRASAPRINFNNIFGNAAGVNSVHAVDASMNWWGSTGGPSGGMVNDKVATGEFLLAPVSNFPPSSLKSLKIKADKTYTTDFSGYQGLNDMIFISAEAYSDASAESYNWTTVIISNEYESDPARKTMTVNLLETGKNSGVYRGVAWTTVRNDIAAAYGTNDVFDILENKAGDIISIASPIYASSPILLNCGTNSVWKKVNNPIRLIGGAILSGYQSPTVGGPTFIEAGVTVEGFYGARINGNIIATAEPASRITFTSAAPVPAMSDWQGIDVWNGSSFTNCDVLYADDALLGFFAVDMLVRRCNIRNCDYGIRVGQYCSPIVVSSNFLSCTNAFNVNTYIGFLRNNNIIGNTNGCSAGGFPLSCVDASENYWGSPSGPSGSGPGSGDSVSTKVAYSSWLMSEVSLESGGAVTGIGLFADKACTVPVTELGVLDNLYIKITGGAGDPLKQNLESVTVARDGVRGTMQIVHDLLETGPASAEYVGVVRITASDSRAGAGNISAEAGDTITVTSVTNPSISSAPLTVTKNAFWRAANNPNRIQFIAPLILPQSYKLTIEAGVTIETSNWFSPDIRYAVNQNNLIINGTLEAVGTQNSPIIMKSLLPAPVKGNAGGFWFGSGSDMSKLRYFEAQKLIQFRVSSSISIDKCKISDASGYYGGGLYITGASSPKIRNSDFVNCDTAGITCTSGSPLIEFNNISGNPSGIYLNGSSPTIRSNSIEANGAGGGGGIVFGPLTGTATSEIINNTIRNNATNVSIDHNSNLMRPRFRYNNIINTSSDIGKWGVSLDLPNAPTVEAANNYWGASSGPYHAVLNPAGNRNSEVTDFVNFTPWLTMEVSPSGPVPTLEFPSNGSATNRVKTDVSVYIDGPYDLYLPINPPSFLVDGVPHIYPDGTRMTYSARRLSLSTTEAYTEGTHEVTLISAETEIGIPLQEPFTWQFIVDTTTPEVPSIEAAPSLASAGTVYATVEVFDSLSGIDLTRSPTVELLYPGGTATFERMSYTQSDWVGSVEVFTSFNNGWASIEVKGVTDRAGNTAALTREYNAVFIDTVSPEVTLYQPNGGEELSWGLEYVVTWEATDPLPSGGMPDNPVEIYLSTGETYPPILITSEAPNSGEYAFIVPNVYSTSCEVLLEVRDLAGNAGHAGSASSFSIQPINPYIVSTRPVDLAHNVPVDRSITYAELVFSKDMNVNGVRASFNISPEAAGYITWDPDLQHFRYNFNNNLQFFTTYEVTITSEATDQLGNPLINAPYTFEFTTASVDVTPPHIGPVQFDGRAYSSPPPDFIMRAEPEIVALITDEASGSGIDRYSFVIKIDGYVYHPEFYKYDTDSGLLTFTVTGESPPSNYVVTIEARDIAGNPATWEGIVRVKLGPLIDNVRFEGRAYYRQDIISNRPVVQATISDEGGSTATVDPSTIRIVLGPNEFLPGASSYDLVSGIMLYDTKNYPTALGPGTFSATIEADDIYGNRGTWTGVVRVIEGSARVIGPVLSYPAPYKPLGGGAVIVSYNLSEKADVSIYFYDISGQVVLTKKFSAGSPGGRAGYNDFQWNGKTDFGNLIGNGIYILKIVSKGRVIGTGKMVVLD